MTNEVTQEAEETIKPEDSVTEETNTENSADKTAEETTAATTKEAVTTIPTAKKTEAAKPVATEKKLVVKAEKADAAPAKTDEGNSPEAAGEKAVDEDTPAADAANDIDFGAILEEFEQDQEEYHSGKLVEGKVVGISEREVLVNFGYKSEGVVPSDEFVSLNGEMNVKVGDEVEVVIRNIYSGDSPPVLSRTDAIHRKSWDLIEKAYNDETIVKGKVISKTKGGLKVDIEGVEAFLPGSQIDSRPIRNLDAFIGEEIESKVIKFSRKRNNIVISRKVLTDEVINVLKAETLSNIEEKYIVDGVIKNLTEYGAFVDLGGIDGLLHVTDMSWGRLHNPNEMFKVNDNVQVKVLKLDREKEKVSLGYKQLYPDPWSTVVEAYPVDSVIEGKVSSVTDYGAFVELEPGVEGLVHISEMSWSKRTKNPKKLVRSNDMVKVQVLGIDTEERRISLGMKQLQENPWETIGDRYSVGSKIIGKVRNLTDFGAFVEVEEGVDGLVHVSDISHSKKIKHPKDVLKKDQEVEAIITNIDTEGHRLSLSIKELTPSAWDGFVENNKPGDVVKGKVSRFAGFGVFVELGDELEGLCHISELADERVEKPEDVVSIGQELDFKILRIENDVQKIGLSARAVGKDDEPIMDSRQYSTEAKSGMASLGELMNLKRGNQDEAEETEVAEDAPKLSKKERRAIRAKEKAEAEARGETVEEKASEDDATGEAETSEEVKAEAPAETEEAKAEDTVESKDENAEIPAADESTTEETAEIPEAKEELAAEEVKEEESAETEVKAEVAEDSAAEEKVKETEVPKAEENKEVKAEVSEAETSKEEAVEEEPDKAKAETDTTEEAKSAESENIETAEEPKGKSDADSDANDSKADDDGKSDADKTTKAVDGKSDADKTEKTDDKKSDADLSDEEKELEEKSAKS